MAHLDGALLNASNVQRHVADAACALVHAQWTSHSELAARAIPCREERVTIEATGITDPEI